MVGNKRASGVVSGVVVKDRVGVAHGFTLIEMLVAISLMLLASVYFANFFLNRLTHEEVRVVARDLMTLNNAIISFYSHEAGWPLDPDPDPDTSECDSDSVELALSDYIAGVDFSRFGFDCSESYRFVVQFDAADEEMAQILSGYLPTAEVVGSTAVHMYIFKPRHLMNIHIGVYLADNNGDVYVPFPKNCSDPQVSASPEIVCSHSTDSGLGGYKIMIDDDPDRDDGWKIWLEARNDEQTAAFQDVTECVDPGTGASLNLAFRVMTFCNDS